jgi:hypothetical protein
MPSRPVTFDPTALRASYVAAGTAFVGVAGRAPDHARVFRLAHAKRLRSPSGAGRPAAS